MSSLSAPTQGFVGLGAITFYHPSPCGGANFFFLAIGIFHKPDQSQGGLLCHSQSGSLRLK